jgi:anthranilate synthase component I
MFTPSRDEFVQASARGNLIPVYREIVADTETPVSAYAAIAGDEYSFLLESVVGGEQWAAYSFVGVAPRAVLRWHDGRANATWFDVDGGGEPKHAQWQVSDPTAALKEVLSDIKPVETPGLPRFWGGAVGWIGYDAVRAFEELPSRAAAGVDVPTMCMVLTDTLLIFDNLRQTLKIVATPYVANPQRAGLAWDLACERINALVDKLQAPRARLVTLQVPSANMPAIHISSSTFSQPDYLSGVEQIREYIRAGDAFQVVLSQRFTLPRAGVDEFTAYRALRLTNPSPYMFHLNYPEATVTGASPETMVRLVDGDISLRPIAGTRRRGQNATEDDALAAELLQDPKECAEHLMLIDLGRNDVGQVAKVGTVRVAETMKIEKYSHVMHLTSHVVGRLASGQSWDSVFKASFPAGTLSGAPKIRAMEIIDEIEPHQRALYGGAVGYVSYTGNMDFAIAIRTMVGCGDSIHVQAGAGIVADSVPTAEYEECINKASAVLRAIDMATSAVPATESSNSVATTDRMTTVEGPDMQRTSERSERGTQ